MTKIIVSNLLAEIQAHYQFGNVNPGEEYSARIVDSVIRPNQFQGTSLRLIFEIMEGEFAGTHVSHILTIQHKDDKYDQSFVDLTGLFFDLNDPNMSFDIEDFIDKKCRILVEDSKRKSKWQKVTKISVF